MARTAPLGRWLDADDQVSPGPLRILLSYGYGQRRFGSDAGLIGRALTLSGERAEIAIRLRCVRRAWSPWKHCGMSEIESVE